MTIRKQWTHDERLLVFRLYCHTPFGKLHQHNAEIVELAKMIGRTPSAVAMKACNFASLDPMQQARNISALGNVSQADRDLWEAFALNPEYIASEVERVFDLALQNDCKTSEEELLMPDRPTDSEQTIRTRRVQSFFRTAVLASYGYRCALSDMAVPELLNASHIIPWKSDISRRADPRNGILLNALFDRAFDRGFITFDESLRLVSSERLRTGVIPPYQQNNLLDFEGRKLRLPQRFAPDPAALAYHREHIFK